MPILTVEPLVLHRRKLVDCTPRSPSSLLYGVNDSFPYPTPYTHRKKFSGAPNVSRNLMLPEAPSTSHVAHDLRTMVSPDDCLSSKYYLPSSNSSSTEPSIPSVPSTPCLQTLELSNNGRNKSLPLINSGISVPAPEDRPMHCLGQTLYQRVIPRTVHINWKQSIDVIRRANDPMRVANKTCVKKEVNTLPKQSNHRIIGSHFPGTGAVPGKMQSDWCETQRYGHCPLGGAALASRAAECWWSRKNFRLGRGLLRLAVNQNDDKIDIEEIRQMLRYSKPYCDDTHLEAEVSGQFSQRSGVEFFCSKGSDLTCDEDKDDASDIKCGEELSGCRIEASCDVERSALSREHTPIDYDKRAQAVADTLDDKLTSEHSSKCDMIEEIIDNNVRPQVAGLLEESEKGWTDCYNAHYPHGSSTNPLPKEHEVTNVQKSRHQGLEIIDKIKDTQQLLARVRVKPKLLTDSDSEEPFPQENQSGGCKTISTPLAKGPNGKKQVPMFKRMRPDTLRLPFTRATVSSQRHARAPLRGEPDYGAGGDGEFSVKGPPPSCAQSPVPSNLKKDIVASLESTLEKPDPETHILSWLQNVEPLVKRRESVPVRAN